MRGVLKKPSNALTDYQRDLKQIPYMECGVLSRAIQAAGREGYRREDVWKAYEQQLSRVGKSMSLGHCGKVLEGFKLGCRVDVLSSEGVVSLCLGGVSLRVKELLKGFVARLRYPREMEMNPSFSSSSPPPLTVMGEYNMSVNIIQKTSSSSSSSSQTSSLLFLNEIYRVVYWMKKVRLCDSELKSIIISLLKAIKIDQTILSVGDLCQFFNFAVNFHSCIHSLSILNEIITRRKSEVGNPQKIDFKSLNLFCEGVLVIYKKTQNFPEDVVDLVLSQISNVMCTDDQPCLNHLFLPILTCLNSEKMMEKDKLIIRDYLSLISNIEYLSENIGKRLGRICYLGGTLSTVLYSTNGSKTNLDILLYTKISKCFYEKHSLLSREELFYYIEGILKFNYKKSFFHLNFAEECKRDDKQFVELVGVIDLALQCLCETEGGFDRLFFCESSLFALFLNSLRGKKFMFDRLNCLKDMNSKTRYLALDNSFLISKMTEKIEKKIIQKTCNSFNYSEINYSDNGKKPNFTQLSINKLNYISSLLYMAHFSYRDDKIISKFSDDIKLQLNNSKHNNSNDVLKKPQLILALTLMDLGSQSSFASSLSDALHNSAFETLDALILARAASTILEEEDLCVKLDCLIDGFALSKPVCFSTLQVCGRVFRALSIFPCGASSSVLFHPFRYSPFISPFQRDVLKHLDRMEPGWAASLERESLLVNKQTNRKIVLEGPEDYYRGTLTPTALLKLFRTLSGAAPLSYTTWESSKEKKDWKRVLREVSGLNEP